MDIINNINYIYELLLIGLKNFQKGRMLYRNRVKSNFKKNIIPAYLEFEKMHHYYIERFNDYLKIIEDNEFIECEEHPLFSAIHQNNINSDSELVNLYHTHQNMFGNLRKLYRSNYYDFMMGISVYFFIAYFAGELYHEVDFDEIHEFPGPYSSRIYKNECFVFDSNDITWIISHMKNLYKDTSPIEEKKQLAIITINTILNKLEDRYNKIGQSYKELERYYTTDDYKNA